MDLVWIPKDSLNIPRDVSKDLLKILMDSEGFPLDSEGLSLGS